MLQRGKRGGRGGRRGGPSGISLIVHSRWGPTLCHCAMHILVHNNPRASFFSPRDHQQKHHLRFQHKKEPEAERGGISGRIGANQSASQPDRCLQVTPRRPARIKLLLCRHAFVRWITGFTSVVRNKHKWDHEEFDDSPAMWFSRSESRLNTDVFHNKASLDIFSDFFQCPLKPKPEY